MTYVQETPKSTLKLLENFDTVLTCLFSNSIFQNRSKVFSPFAFRLSEDLKSVKESLSFSICNCSLFQFIKLIMSSFDNSISSSALLSAVGNVSGYRCVSDCRSRGREFDPGPVPYFRGD